MTTRLPWDIYTEQLFPIGFGHPLWVPEPIDNREVHVGDIGWFENGGFRPLFNSMKPSDDSANKQKGVPPGFVPFQPQEFWVRRGDKIKEGSVCSATVEIMQGGGLVDNDK